MTLAATPIAGAGPGGTPAESGSILPGPFVWATAVFPSGQEFRLEIARTPVERARGYMFREQVADEEGMLFLFPEDGLHEFWMKNCRVALDLIWLDADLQVVQIAAEQLPCPEEGPCPDIFPMRPARYVLEVAAGVAARHGLQVGDRVAVLSEPPLR